MKIILTGMKGCGKTTVGMLLAEKLQIPFLDSDAQIEKMHERESGEALSFREIFKQYGENYFNALDVRTLRYIARDFGKRDFVLACGGRTPLQTENQEILRTLGTLIFLNVEKKVLLQHILAQGIPGFFPYPDDPEKSLAELLSTRFPFYKKIASITLDIGEETPEQLVGTLLGRLKYADEN